MSRAKALFAEEPAVVSAAVAAVLGWAASFLVLHGVVSNTVASATVQEVTPSVVSLALLAVGVFIRQYVTPAVHDIEGALGRAMSHFEPAISPGIRTKVSRTEADLTRALSRLGYPQTTTSGPVSLYTGTVGNLLAQPVAPVALSEIRTAPSAASEGPSGGVASPTPPASPTFVPFAS